jgi:tagatose-1,6-bisphosphate aldolase non-catalytic subunit AgaZ/GatZ
MVTAAAAQKKEFIVGTSRLKTTLAEQEQESRSLRKLENQMLVTSGSFKNYYQ